MPNLNFKQCDIRIDLRDAVIQTSNNGNETKNWGGYYFGNQHEKSYLEKLMDGKYYKDLEMHAYNIVTQKSGDYYIVDVDVDYEYKRKKDSEYLTIKNKGKITIKLLPKDPKDISTYKVVSFSMVTSDQDNEYSTLTTEKQDIVVEADIPYTGTEYDFYFNGNVFR